MNKEQYDIVKDRYGELKEYYKLLEESGRTNTPKSREIERLIGLHETILGIKRLQ
jgi:hypothetical protein